MNSQTLIDRDLLYIQHKQNHLAPEEEKETRTSTDSSAHEKQLKQMVKHYKM